ncbi:hypothetical protein [Kineococcus sp. NUM-3379]
MDRTADGGTGPSWHQPGFLASAGFLAMVAAGGLTLVLTGGADPGRATAAPAPAPPAPSAPAPADTAPAADPSTCGLPEGPQVLPRQAPQGVTWELLDGTAVPSAPRTFGPGRVTDGLRTCYAHSPTGAVLAAAGVFATTGVPSLVGPMMRELTAAGPGRDAALRRLAAEGVRPEPSGPGVQVTGFQVLAYTAAEATVDLAFAVREGGGRTGYVSWPATLRWEDGDWKLVLDDAGEFTAGVQGLPDLTGYVYWSGL